MKNSKSYSKGKANPSSDENGNKDKKPYHAHQNTTHRSKENDKSEKNTQEDQRKSSH